MLFTTNFLQNYRPTVILKFFIITKLIRSPNSMMVIFLMAEFWGFVTTFCQPEDYYQNEIV
jgi:hypothetical protein